MEYISARTKRKPHFTNELGGAIHIGTQIGRNFRITKQELLGLLEEEVTRQIDDGLQELEGDIKDLKNEKEELENKIQELEDQNKEYKDTIFDLERNKGDETE